MKANLNRWMGLTLTAASLCMAPHTAWADAATPPPAQTPPTQDPAGQPPGPDNGPAPTAQQQTPPADPQDPPLTAQQKIEEAQLEDHVDKIRKGFLPDEYVLFDVKKDAWVGGGSGKLFKPDELTSYLAADKGPTPAAVAPASTAPAPVTPAAAPAPVAAAPAPVVPAAAPATPDAAKPAEAQKPFAPEMTMSEAEATFILGLPGDSDTPPESLFKIQPSRNPRDPNGFTLLGSVFADCVKSPSQFNISKTETDNHGILGLTVSDPGGVVRSCMAKHKEANDHCNAGVSALECVGLSKMFHFELPNKDVEVRLVNRVQGDTPSGSPFVTYPFSHPFFHKSTATLEAEAQANAQAAREAKIKRYKDQIAKCTQTEDDLSIRSAARSALVDMGIYLKGPEAQNYARTTNQAIFNILVKKINNIGPQSGASVDEVVRMITDGHSGASGNDGWIADDDSEQQVVQTDKAELFKLLINKADQAHDYATAKTVETDAESEFSDSPAQKKYFEQLFLASSFDKVKYEALRGGAAGQEFQADYNGLKQLAYQNAQSSCPTQNSPGCAAAINFVNQVAQIPALAQQAALQQAYAARMQQQQQLQQQQFYAQLQQSLNGSGMYGGQFGMGAPTTFGGASAIPGAYGGAFGGNSFGGTSFGGATPLGNSSLTQSLMAPSVNPSLGGGTSNYFNSNGIFGSTGTQGSSLPLGINNSPMGMPAS